MQAVQVIAFLSASGGVGKTTIAAHLAYMFRREGSNVLLVDMDPSAGLSVMLLGEQRVLELEGKGRTIGDAFLRFLKGGSVEISDYVVQANLGEFTVDVVPSGDSLSDAMGLLWFSGSYPSPEQKVREFLERSDAQRWDVILLDTIPFYERRYTLTSLYTADKVVIVTHPYGTEPQRVKRMYSKLAQIVRSGIDIKARVLVNKVDIRTEEGKKALERIDATLNLPRFNTVIHGRVCYTRVLEMECFRGRNKSEREAVSELKSFFGELKDWLSVQLTLG
jgi:chromosome partitioning protein